MELEKENIKEKRIFLIALCMVTVLLVGSDWVLSVMVYEENFNKRFESYGPLMLDIDDFDSLPYLPIFD